MSFAGLRGKGLFVCRRPRALSKCLSTVCSEQIRISYLRNRLSTNVKRKLPLYSYNISYGYYSTLPSHTVVPLPALSPTMEMGTIVSWSKKEGEKLNDGDLLAEIETDKATMGFETPEEGYLAKILVPAGTKDVPVGKPVCVICENESDIASFANFEDDGGSSLPKMPVSPTLSTPSTPPQPPTPAPTPSTVPPAPVTPPVTQQSALTEKGRVYASPMAKNLAEKKNIRLEDVGKGSGIYGSVKVADLQMLKEKPVVQQVQSATSAAPYEDLPISGMRSAIAKKLLQSKQISPHFYTSVECVMDEILSLKSKLNAVLEKQNLKLTVNDFVVKATALATRKVPAANSAWLETVIRRYRSVDVCVAVSIESGLITPIVFGADTKGLIEISENIKSLSKKAKEGTLQPQEFQGGTITVSNMGMYGVLHFCPIINPPQACILGVGSAHEKFVPVNGVGVAKKVMIVTMSADHRVVDGAIAAQWLRAFREFIEQPHRMLL